LEGEEFRWRNKVSIHPFRTSRKGRVINAEGFAMVKLRGTALIKFKLRADDRTLSLVEAPERTRYQG
jgi:hypothetical protein